jgi:uncharacterized glyoxalase superfamily protein PhnB
VTSDNKTHSILPFVPAKDFEVSTAFYRALGFDVAMDDDVRHCSSGDAGFLLQDFYVKAWANNSMLAMHVDDAQAWLNRADEIAADFPGVRTAPLELQDWGQLLGHIWDPSGVLWHITQTPSKG